MKRVFTLVAALFTGVASFGQTAFDPEIQVEHDAPTVVLPPSPLKYQVLFVGGVDEVEALDEKGNPSGAYPAKENHDFIGLTLDPTSDDYGWISVNHEMVIADPNLGDGGGMTVFKVKRDPATDTLIIVEQELSDGRVGEFFNVDFSTTGETGMNCGGIVGPDGRIWTAEEWWRGNNNSIEGGITDLAPYKVKSDLAGDFDGKTIEKYENLNYMVEIDPREAKAVRKQYNWGRQPFEGGAILPDNRTVFLGADATPGFLSKFVADQPGNFNSGKLYVYKEDNTGRGVRLLGSYHTGIFAESAAEIATYDPTTKQVYFVNSESATVDIININDPANPTFVQKIDLTTYGGGANSVDIHNGVLAVAVQANNKQENGSIVFFDNNGTFINQITAGALPDMVTFSPDGTKVLAANEGEPNDDYTVDPEGSITIIDITSGVANITDANATQVTFEGYNDKKASLINKGVRIFGPNATVAQDLEPEYITITKDGSKAYVALQENNALAVIDLTTDQLVDILALGYKDHSKGAPMLTEHIINEKVELPSLGVSNKDGVEYLLGGFSGLWFDESASSENEQVYYAIPDRGPNAATVAKADAGTSQNLRPFMLPDYQGRIAKFTLNPKTGEIALDSADQIYLTRKDGITPISGKGNIPGVDEVPVAYTDGQVFTDGDYTVGDLTYSELDYDAFGGDFEGILIDKNGKFWMCDEYRPAIYQFEPNGTLIERYVAEGTAALGTTPQTAGFYGAETLPAVYAKRWANRGFEAIAYDSAANIIYTFIQSPLYNPSSITKNQSDVIRILGIDATNGTPVSEYVYLLERNRDAGIGNRVDKIGDAVYIGNGRFMVIERDSSEPGDKTGKKNVYEIDIKYATNILNLPISSKTTSTDENDKTLEMMTADDLAANDIKPVFKLKMFNLVTVGHHPSDKAEGIVLLPNGDIAVINDNDFGITTEEVVDPISLGIISFKHNYGFDASNKSDEISFENHPTLGMFMPDAIASYEVNGQNYIVTTNEGDGRDYDGYSDEERVKDLNLNPIEFPNADDLQEDDNLGRLKTTSANGDLDGDGTHDRLFSYGGRSFTIWDEAGNLVFDCGDDFAKRIAAMYPNDFNSTNDENDSGKNRSDDKGAEPEAIAIKEIEGRTYAFIGLERMGGVVTYDISNPKAPFYIRYDLNRDFSVPADSIKDGVFASGDLGPEHVEIIDAVDSPTGETLMMVSNEVSGSISFYSVNDVPAKNGENKWVEMDNSSLEAALVYSENAITAKATMFNRLEWVSYNKGNGKVYMTETGRDNPASRWINQHQAGAVHAKHTMARATAQNTHPDSSNYWDYYGRVLEYDPVTEDVNVYIEAGPYYSESPTEANYPEKHLSNPDGLNFLHVNNKDYMIICEDLNGSSHGRVPSSAEGKTCEMFLLDMTIEDPTPSDLIRISQAAFGAEITGAVATPDGKTILVNSQHPKSTNPEPYNHSVTVAITGWDVVLADQEVDKGTTSLNDFDENSFNVYPNPASREVKFDKAIDAALYDESGKRLKVIRNSSYMDLNNFDSGIYFIKSDDGELKKIVIQK